VPRPKKPRRTTLLRGFTATSFPFSGNPQTNSRSWRRPCAARRLGQIPLHGALVFAPGSVSLRGARVIGVDPLFRRRLWLSAVSCLALLTSRSGGLRTSFSGCTNSFKSAHGGARRRPCGSIRSDTSSTRNYTSTAGPNTGGSPSPGTAQGRGGGQNNNYSSPVPTRIPMRTPGAGRIRASGGASRTCRGWFRSCPMAFRGRSGSGCRRAGIPVLATACPL
jgi:hypothetical protein